MRFMAASRRSCSFSRRCWTIW